ARGKDNETLKITVGVVFMLLMIFLSLGLWAMYRNQDQLQNAQSFASEWDDSKDSDCDSSDDVYQV
ncbi:putative L-galactonate transporter, partial [Clarias magur]